MNQQIVNNLGLTASQIAEAVRHIQNGEGLFVVAECLGLDDMRESEMDRLIDALGIFEFAQAQADSENCRETIAHLERNHQ